MTTEQASAQAYQPERRARIEEHDEDRALRDE